MYADLTINADDILCTADIEEKLQDLLNKVANSERKMINDHYEDVWMSGRKRTSSELEIVLSI